MAKLHEWQNEQLAKRVVHIAEASVKAGASPESAVKAASKFAHDVIDTRARNEFIRDVMKTGLNKRDAERLWSERKAEQAPVAVSK